MKSYADNVYPMQQVKSTRAKTLCRVKQILCRAFQRNKKLRCEAPVVGQPRKNCMYVVDTCASLIALSGCTTSGTHPERKKKTDAHSLRQQNLDRHGNEVGSPKNEMFASLIFAER